MTRLRTALLGGAALTAALGVALAGCSSSGDDTSSSPPVSTPAPSTSDPTPTTSTPVPSTTAPSSTPAPSTTPPASSTPAPSSTPPPPSTTPPATPAFTTTCPKLTVMVIPGGAIRGAEIAAVQYVNDGSAACTITGTPAAMLLRNGAAIGTPAGPDGTTVRPYTLRPGEVGESLLRDFSTCNAPLSDSIRVSTPSRGGDSTRTVVRPARLRACRLQLAPVGRPA